MSRAVPVQVGVHLVFEGWGFALALACGNGGRVSWVVEQTGSGERLSVCGGVPVKVDGCRSRDTRRHGGCFGQGGGGVSC